MWRRRWRDGGGAVRSHITRRRVLTWYLGVVLTLTALGGLLHWVAVRPTVFGPYIHQIDPILFDIAGVHVWWYGLGFALGFLEIHLFLRRGHGRFHLSLRDVWSLSLFIAVGVLVGGRFVEITFDEWPFYREHLGLIPAYWLGGMATHGLMFGGAVGAGLFALLYRKPFLLLADTLVIPAALLMGLGRLGNFIDGQIVGAVTEVWWAVQFPDADGFRHPVVLYDGAKNLLLMAYLMWVRRANRTPGATAARFVFWYAFPRFFIDLFRDYPTHRLALGTGQTLNIVMVLLGAALLYRSRLRRLGRLKSGLGCHSILWWVTRRDAPDLPARRLRVPAGILPDNSEQLDPRYPVQVWRAAPGAGVLLAVPQDRYRAAGACRHGDARSVLSPFGSQCARCCPQTGGQDPRADWHPARYDQPSRAGP